MAAAEKFDAQLPFWPAAMTRAMALSYTGVSEAQLKEWERAGKVRFRRRGANGASIALTEELQAALRSLFDGEGSPDEKPEF